MGYPSPSIDPPPEAARYEPIPGLGLRSRAIPFEEPRTIHVTAPGEEIWNRDGVRVLLSAWLLRQLLARVRAMGPRSRKRRARPRLDIRV